MGIAFCSDCDGHIYVSSSEDISCPVCSSNLTETEETIIRRAGA